MVTIQLDTNAIRFLIEADPNFELEIKNAVLRNIVDDVRKSHVTEMFREEIRKIIVETHSDFIEKIKTDESIRQEIKIAIERVSQSARDGLNSYIRTRKLSDESATLVRKTVEDLVANEAKEALGDTAKFVEKVKEKFEYDAKYRLERALERLDTKWKAEVAAQIRSSVADEINAAFKKSIVGE